MFPPTLVSLVDQTLFTWGFGMQACTSIPVADLVNECTQAVDEYSKHSLKILSWYTCLFSAVG